MLKPFSWICGILAVLASQPANAATSAAASGPDLNLAYVLATASYCAYAVGAIDSDGEKLADQGRQRALDCLTAAVEADPSRLAALKVEARGCRSLFQPGETPERLSADPRKEWGYSCLQRYADAAHFARQGKT